MATEPHTIYVAAETWFNIAEAAVNGWNVGSYTAKQAMKMVSQNHSNSGE